MEHEMRRLTDSNDRPWLTCFVRYLSTRLLVVVSVIIISICSLQLSTNATAAKQKMFVVGFAQDTMANDWRASQVHAIAEAFKQYPNVKFIYTDGKGRSAKQIGDLEDLALQGVDLIMTSPRDAQAMTPVISKIYKSGIPVVLVTRKINNNDFTAYVSPNDYTIAQRAAKFMAKRLNNKGSVLILKGLPTATTAIARTDGFIEEIKKYPNIKIAGIKNGNYLRSDAIRATEEAINSGLKFDAIYAQSDSMASGARLALLKADIAPSKLVIVGIDYIQEAQEAIKNGLQTASFMYPTCAEESVYVAMKILNKKKIPRHTTVKSKIITKNNVNEINPIF